MKLKLVILGMSIFLILISFIIVLSCPRNKKSSKLVVEELDISDIDHFKDILSSDEKTKLENLLKEMIIYFEKIEIPYFFAFGSLIGVARHGQRMPWDDDIDIVISHANYDKLTKDLPVIKKNRKGIFYKLNNGIVIKTKNWGVPIKVFYEHDKNGYAYPFIDIMTYNEENGHLIIPDKQLENGHIYHFNELKSDIFPMKKGRFHDSIVNIPKEYNKILKNQYGLDVLDVAHITFNHKPYCDTDNVHGCENNNTAKHKINMTDFPSYLHKPEIFD